MNNKTAFLKKIVRQPCVITHEVFELSSHRNVLLFVHTLDHTARVSEIHFHFFASKAAESRIATETFHVGSRGLFRGVSAQRPRAPFPAHRDFECGWRIGDLDAKTSHLPGCRKPYPLSLFILIVCPCVARRTLWRDESTS